MTPELEVTEFVDNVGMTVPSLHPETVTVKLDAVPVVGDGENVQPVEVPLFVISDAVKVDASIDEINVSV